MTESFFFCGVGGSGMSALAQLLKQKGYDVRGSDRSNDKAESPDKFKFLADAGITLYPQDGSGVTNEVGTVVVSSAVEPSIPDVKMALDQDIPVKKRAAVLADLVNKMRGITIGGTSGKTTVTGMVAHMLYEMGQDPTVMNGGQIVNFLDKGLSGNALCGQSDLFVTETDESDGSIAFFEPAIAVVNNVTLDHKPIEELRPLFRDFVAGAREFAVVNIDDPEAAKLAGINPDTITFSYANAEADITADDVELDLLVPGKHNIMNALAALCVAKALDLDLHDAARALGTFKGIKRRFEIIGTVNGITVIDDFGHNPDKIEATLDTVHMCGNRVIAIFQPHGFGPTRMLKDGLIETFSTHLAEQDILLMPEIYYAGGTADKSISSRDIIDEVSENGCQAHFMESREAMRDFIAMNAKPNDRIVIMGARDDTLSDFARDILASLKQKAA